MTDEEKAAAKARVPSSGKEARVVICVRRAGQTRKLAWFKEDATGIYSGFFGVAKDTHWSYHVDGEVHLKRGNKRRFPGKATPIDKLSGLTPILSATTMAISALARASDDFKPNDKAVHIFLPELSDLADDARLSVTRSLIDHPNEAESIDKLLRFPPTIIGLVTVPLLHHPTHKLAVLVTADSVGTLDTKKH